MWKNALNNFFIKKKALGLHHYTNNLIPAFANSIF